MNAATVMLLKAQRSEIAELLAEIKSSWFDGGIERIGHLRRKRLEVFRERIEYAIIDAMNQLDDARKSREKKK